MGRVFLNIDLGEMPDEPVDLYACAHVANVACGGHAGDATSMHRAVELCDRYGTLLGAHPSYPDPGAFGRRHVPMNADALEQAIAAQLTRLVHVADQLGQPIRYVKAHGALYHDAHVDVAIAVALVTALLDSLGAGIVVIGPPAGALSLAAARSKLGYAVEGFADRARRPDGTLVPRSEPGALVTDPSIASGMCRDLVAGGAVDTVCVHGDTPGALSIARAVRAVLDAPSPRGTS